MGMNFYTFGKEQYHLHLEMEQWCRNNIGQGSWGGAYVGDVWSIDSMFGNTTFAFKNPNHLTMFVLRWA
jgi:hypothetical protein